MARLLLALCCASAYGLVPSAAPRSARSVALQMSESSTALVPVNDENIKASSAVTAAGAGLVLGGPVLAVVTAALGNYATTTESEVGEVVRGVGKVSLDVYNFLLKLNGKYDLSDKASAAVKEQLEKLKAGESGETMTKVEDAVTTVTSKVGELKIGRASCRERV